MSYKSVKQAQKMEKRVSKKKGSAERDNNRVITALMEGDNHFVLGRVEKNLGAGGFHVLVHNGHVVGMPIGKFTRSTMPIGENTFVVLEPSTTGRAKVLEIVGVLSRKNAKLLYKEKRLSKTVWKTDEDDDHNDDLFEDEDEDVAGEGDVKEDKQGKCKSVKGEDDDSDSDVDVNDI
jgi:hypothetical protein